MMKKLIFSLFMLISIALSAKADKYFEYPIVPDSIASYQARCDYQAQHFFDFCDLSKAFSNRTRMGEEFNVYLTITDNATPRVADREARAFMKKLEKQPADQLFIAELAEARLYGDSAQAWLDALYLPYAESVAANRRIGKAEKARFAQQAQQLRNSTVGQRIFPLPYTRPDGSTGNLAADSAEVTVIFFNTPGCDECEMARMRLAFDISTTDLIREGKMKVVSISLCEPDSEWHSFIASMPDEWVKGAAPDADLALDLRAGTPSFYILGRGSRIKFKHLDIDALLDVSRQLKKR